MSLFKTLGGIIQPKTVITNAKEAHDFFTTKKNSFALCINSKGESKEIAIYQDAVDFLKN